MALSQNKSWKRYLYNVLFKSASFGLTHKISFDGLNRYSQIRHTPANAVLHNNAATPADICSSSDLSAVWVQNVGSVNEGI